jgi:hypothetical protein
MGSRYFATSLMTSRRRGCTLVNSLPSLSRGDVSCINVNPTREGEGDLAAPVHVAKQFCAFT